MPWQVGIDEAGYGPNLGPFVMTMVTAKVPAERANADLWKLLRRVVRRPSDKADNRVLVGDSKQVYAPAQGLGSLEAHVGPFLWLLTLDNGLDPSSLEAVWTKFCLTPLTRLRDELWSDEASRLPASDHPLANIQRCATRLQAAMAKAQACVCGFRWVVIFPSEFNKLTLQHDSKGAVSRWALEQLLPYLPEEADSEYPSALFVDKHGGRNCYYEMLQSALDPKPVMIHQESARCSHYRAETASGTWDMRFEPEADDRHFTVALASMFSKYLREVLMLQFNRFWQLHVPGLRPTAGYPGDSRRFWKDITPARERLGIAEEVLWRVR